MKYKNKKVEYDGHVFDSGLELDRYLYLKQLGAVQELTLQPRFLLIEGFRRKGVKIRDSFYYADFQYRMNGVLIVEDTKGMKTDVYKLKRKLLLVKYPEINFVEVTRKKGVWYEEEF